MIMINDNQPSVYIYDIKPTFDNHRCHYFDYPAVDKPSFTLHVFWYVLNKIFND